MGLRSVSLAGALLCSLTFAVPAGAATKAPEQMYVALGDSYTAGYVATAKGVGSNTRDGFAYQLVPRAAKRGYRLKLVNFGCSGATTASILNEVLPADAGCRGPGAPKVVGTQVGAATKYLKANRKKLGLITVSIGGNDVTNCVAAADPVPCVIAAQGTIEKNLESLLRRLRAAAGSKVRIIGITYPDVVLGQWVGENPNQGLAAQSQVAFQSIINPALQRVYEEYKATFIDVTEATGGYGSLKGPLVEAPGFGPVPRPVAEVCRLTTYCEFRDIHPRPLGYAEIADLVAKALPRAKAKK